VTELRLADAFPSVGLEKFALPFNTILVGDRSSPFLGSVREFFLHGGAGSQTQTLPLWMWWLRPMGSRTKAKRISPVMLHFAEWIVRRVSASAVYRKHRTVPDRAEVFHRKQEFLSLLSASSAKREPSRSIVRTPAAKATEVSISPGLGTVPGHDRHEDEITIANKRYL